jgi:Tol biopolymer transport system component
VNARVGARFPQPMWAIARALSLVLGIGLLWLSSSHATVPGENGKIAFFSNRAEPSGGIYVMNPDGSGASRVGATPGSDAEPAWSPDGKRIVFVNHDGGDGEIYLMNANGQGRVALTSNSSQEFQPSWSPDGEKILFTSDRDGNYEIYVMNADGTGQTNLTNHPAHEQDAVWSPDGQKIAFGTLRGGNESEIYTMKPDGSGLENLTNNTTIFDASPSWSPDGTKLAFDSAQDGALRIWTMNADGTGRTRVTDGFGDFLPAWSPDGEWITFTAYGGPGLDQEVVKVRVNGTERTDITNHPAYDAQPDWQAVQPGYPRPKGATPILVSLVPSYKHCTIPNSTHGAPLAAPSCAPPVQESSYATVGNPPTDPANSVGTLRLDVAAGDPATEADEADVLIRFSLTDVLQQPGLVDYRGELRGAFNLRITDRDLPFGAAGTATDLPFGFNIGCAATMDPTIGSSCSLSTTADTLIPGAIKEGRRATWDVGQVVVFDGGSDGMGSTEADNTPFERQGVFVP